MGAETEPTDAVARGVLQAVLHSAVDAIITIDTSGTIRSVNPATTRMFGYSQEDLIGKNVSLLMPEPYRGEHDGYLASYLRSGQAKVIGLGREVVGLRRDGTTFPIHLAVSEFRLGDDRYFAGMVRDITDLKVAEARLQELNNELEHRVAERTEQLREAQAELVAKERLATLGQIAGGIAHEIRNPLNAVRTSVYYLLHARNPSSEKVREHLERIDRQVSNINQVVTALSDVARLPEAQLVRVDIVELIDEVVRSVSLPSRIQVQREVVGAVPAVWGDPLQLPLLFRNLVRNARDAIAADGTLTVRIETTSQTVRITIADTGIGISPEDLPRITEPLYSTKARGMGLGLAIARAIVDKNQGVLSITSQVGQGSQFAVELKRAE